MTDSLPDPLSLWLHASGAPSEAVGAESLAASMQALWSNQEELLRTLGAAFDQAQIAELAIELMLRPLIRQAQLLELAPIPNPKQAVLLSAVLNSWLAAQVAIAQAAAGDLHKDGRPEADTSILQAWVWAFATRQAHFLQSDKGQQLFADLSQAWAGLDVRSVGVDLASAERRPSQLVSLVQQPLGVKPALLLVAPPWCPLASFNADSCGLIKGLEKSFDLQVLDWGGLQYIQSTEGLREQVAGAVAVYGARHGALVLDMTTAELLPADGSLEICHVALRYKLGRFQSVLEGRSIQQLGLARDFIPGELLAVLCDAIYPDWAVESWLQSEAGSSALQLRRAWLAAMPSVSGGLLCDLTRREVSGAGQETNIGLIEGFESLTLLQLLNGERVEELCRALLAKTV